MATALKTRTAQRAKGEGSVFPRKDDNGKPTGKWLAQVTLKGPDGKKISGLVQQIARMRR
jgi:hypothetical protein